MRQIVHLDEDGPEDRAVFGVEVRSANIRARLADGLHDIGIEAAAVFAADRETDREGLSGGFLPVDVYPTLIGRQRQQVGTIEAVNRDTASLGDVADHG